MNYPDRVLSSRSWRRWAIGLALVPALSVAVWLGGPPLRGWYHLRAAHQAIADLALDRADEHLGRCVAIRPQDASMHLLLAQTARRRGDLDTADRELGICARLGTDGPARSLEQAMRQAQVGNLREVEERLKRVARTPGPDRLLALEALTQGYMETLRFREAEACADAILTDWPHHFPALLWRGRVREYHDDYAAALADYQRALGLRPESDEARQRVAENLKRLGRLREATAQWELLHERQPHLSIAVLHLARCRHDEHDLDGAAHLLDELLAEQPDDVLALVERAHVALRQDHAGQAETWLRRAVALAPAEREPTATLAICLERLHKIDESEQCTARVHRIEIETTRLAALKRQALRSPRDPSLRHEIGTMLLKRGDTGEGVRWLQSALQIEPNYTPAHRALADFYSRQGRQQ